MAIPKDEVQAMYQSGAKNYDFTAKLFRLLGIGVKAYRKLTIKKLSLQPGDFVIELGCGTGLNFPFIMDKIGAEGRLIGIDLTKGILDIARERVKKSQWRNIELIQSDITAYDFPKGVDGVLSTGVFGCISEYERVIKRASESLVESGHIVIVDGKMPETLSPWLFKMVMKLGGPFGYTVEYFKVRPWVAVETYFKEVSLEKKYEGMFYILSGTAY